jgi:hypothetical protein
MFAVSCVVLTEKADNEENIEITSVLLNAVGFCVWRRAHFKTWLFSSRFSLPTIYISFALNYHVRVRRMTLACSLVVTDNSDLWVLPPLGS